MAQAKRTSQRARGGGKLALFEVIQAAQSHGEGHLSDAVAPLVQASISRESPVAPAEPVRVANPPAEPAPAATASRPLSAPPPHRAASSRPRRDGGVSIIGFATAVAGVIAITGAGLVAFQHFARSEPHEISGSLPMPEVLDVGSSGESSTPSFGSPLNPTQTAVRAPTSSGRAVVPDGFRRTNGLNYVLMQSYHASEEQQAVATRDALLDAGVGATIERDIPGWEKRLSVVGTDGFEQMKNNPQYQEYRRRLDDVSRKATAADRRIKKFEPQAVQWGRS